MRLLSFSKDGGARLGVRRGESVVDLSLAAPDLAITWPGVFAADQTARVAQAVAAAPKQALVPDQDLRLLPPIPRPPKLICIGLNYRSHAVEIKMDIPDYPIVFMRYPTSVVAHGEALVAPAASDQFDYEAEMAAVIGVGGRRIPVEAALDHVIGYSNFNEGSVRDYQFKSSQWAMGKNFDASGSFGPDIVTADELPPGGAGLRIQCRLNGDTVQDSNTDDLIFDIPTLVSSLSEVMTLEPGDVIVTGTPAGVGFVRKPPLFMKAGDTCEIEIEGIGILRNPVVAEAV